MELTTFKTKFQEQMNNIETAFLDFPWSNRHAYALFMKQTHEFCKHTPTLLLRCSSLLGHDLRNQKRFINHALEEWKHDELAARDILNLGYDIADLPAYALTKAFVQSQYYWIDHVNPMAFFGYILFLETLPTSSAAQKAQEIVSTCYPEALNFGKVHVGEDPKHIVSAWKVVMGFDDSTLQLVYDNLLESGANYISILQLSKAELENRG